jgi:hypothetical protein
MFEMENNKHEIEKENFYPVNPVDPVEKNVGRNRNSNTICRRGGWGPVPRPVHTRSDGWYITGRPSGISPVPRVVRQRSPVWSKTSRKIDEEGRNYWILRGRENRRDEF